MHKTLVLILIGKRRESAVRVQNILTESGCYIKTRLGVHDGVLTECSDTGLIVLEVVGEKSVHEQLVKKLNGIAGVHAKMVELSLND
ncbi:MAG: hypothetical protein PHO30_02805 [Candidatus Omnitrophica bacterium]|jgi:hypothetical protein|nr:hypothetical protein [Candidatus Omnitrophota bacterium]